MTVERDLADAVLRDALLLQRVAAGDQTEADRILSRLSEELRQLILLSDITADDRRKLNAMLKEADAIIANGYGDLSKVVDTEQIAEIIGGHTSGAIGKVLDVTASPVAAERLASLTGDVMIEGAPLSAWWAKQADDTRFRFAQQVRQGVINGETQAQIVARIVGKGGEPGVMDVSRRHARTLVHSAAMSAANQARLATFRKNSEHIAGVKFLATLDSHVCAQCAAHDGAKWDLDGKPIKGTSLPFDAPPLHANCRCVLSPVAKSLDELGLTGMDAAIDALGGRSSSQGPTGSDTSMSGFLQRQSSEFVERALGKGRADLFLSGKLTLRDLVSGTGRPLTLAELRAR